MRAAPIGELPKPSAGDAPPKASHPSIQVQLLRGANPYSRYSVVRAAVMSGTRLPSDTRTVAIAADRLGLPTPLRLEPAAPLGRIIESVVEAIRRRLNLAPIEVDPSQRPDNEFVIPLDPEELAPLISELALGIVYARPPERLAAQLESICATRDRIFSHVHMNALGRECARRGIPWRRLPWSSGIHQIGEGARQLRVDLTVTSHTTRLGALVSGDKAMTNRLLARFGVPVPRQMCPTTPKEAWAAALSLGLPVVVKPRHGNLGRGVSVNLTKEAEVTQAFRQALQISGTAVVESLIDGADHRVLVANGKIVSIVKRVPARVVADGHRSIRQLVAIENRNPERSEAHKLTLLKTISIDNEMERRVAAHGYALDSVPPSGETIYLRFGGNLSRGATAEDVTDAVHPDNAAMLVEAARLVGLDICGIDFLTRDIAVPWHENGAAICEVNSRVATRAHMAAELGTEKSVIARLLDAIYDAPNSGRAPTVLICGGAWELALALAAELGDRLALAVGAGAADRLVVAGAELFARPRSLFEAHTLLAERPDVELILLHATPDRIQGEGLGVSHADVICVAEAYASADGGSFGDDHAILRRTGGDLLHSPGAEKVIAALQQRGAI